MVYDLNQVFGRFLVLLDGIKLVLGQYRVLLDPNQVFVRLLRLLDSI